MLTDPQFSKLRLLVHVHVYHVQHYPELRQCLENLQGLQFDLYVSMSADHPEIEDDIRAFKSDAVIFKCPNRGFDVAPFVDVLNRVNLDDYDLVIKLHTKRDTESHLHFASSDMSLWRWREKLLSFIKYKENFEKTLTAFMEQEDLGIVSNHEIILEENLEIASSRSRQIFGLASKYMDEKVDIGKHPSDKCLFVAGTMFIVRAKVLKELKALHISYDDFPEIGKNKNEFELAHILERVLCWIITSQKVHSDKSGYYTIKDPFTCQSRQVLHNFHKWFDKHIWYRYRPLRKIVRFIIRKDYSQVDNWIYIRFFKICIYKYKNH